MAADPHLLNLVRGEFSKLEDLFAAGEDVQELVAQPGWLVLQRLIESEVAEIDQRLDRLAFSRDQPTLAEYAGLHGRRGGLLALDGMAEAILAIRDRRLEQEKDQYEHAGESA